MWNNFRSWSKRIRYPNDIKRPNKFSITTFIIFIEVRAWNVTMYIPKMYSCCTTQEIRVIYDIVCVSVPNEEKSALSILINIERKRCIMIGHFMSGIGECRIYGNSSIYFPYFSRLMKLDLDNWELYEFWTADTALRKRNILGWKINIFNKQYILRQTYYESMQLSLVTQREKRKNFTSFFIIRNKFWWRAARTSRSQKWQTND